MFLVNGQIRLNKKDFYTTNKICLRHRVARLLTNILLLLFLFFCFVLLLINFFVIAFSFACDFQGNSLMFVPRKRSSTNSCPCHANETRLQKNGFTNKTKINKIKIKTTKCSSKVELQVSFCRFYLKCENVFCLKGFVRCMTKKFQF